MGAWSAFYLRRRVGGARFIKFTALSPHPPSDSKPLTQAASINPFLFQYAFRPVE